MGKANKSVKTAGNAAHVKQSKGKPALRAIKGGKNGGGKTPSKAAGKPAQKSAALKPVMLKPAPAVADDVPVIALNLDPVKLSPAMAAYFKKCQEKLGFVPNVLLAYAFDMA